MVPLRRPRLASLRPDKTVSHQRQKPRTRPGQARLTENRPLDLGAVKVEGLSVEPAAPPPGPWCNGDITGSSGKSMAQRRQLRVESGEDREVSYTRSSLREQSWPTVRGSWCRRGAVMPTNARE